MIDDHRNRILQAAARVYAQHGWRGATTRRIAEEAGVNEVTIFRHFGSKDALLDIAMRESSRVGSESSLPLEPMHPEHELTAWASANYDRICDTRAMVRQMISDACTRPDAMECAKHGPSAALAQLREYVVGLRRDGWISEADSVRPADVAPAISMLMGALFNDAMNRDMMPELFPQSPAETLRAYVRIFLRGIGARPEPSSRGSRTPAAALSPSASHVE